MLAFPVILLFYLLVAPGVRETILPNIMAGIFCNTNYFCSNGSFLSFSTAVERANSINHNNTPNGFVAIFGIVFGSDPFGIVGIEPNELNIFAAVVFTTSPGVFRIVRGLTLDIRTRDYVAAAVTRGGIRFSS